MESLTPELLAVIACQISSTEDMLSFLSCCRATHQLQHEIPQVQLCIYLLDHDLHGLAKVCADNHDLVGVLSHLLQHHHHLLPASRHTFRSERNIFESLLVYACEEGCLPLVQLVAADVTAMRVAGLAHPADIGAGPTLVYPGHPRGGRKAGLRHPADAMHHALLSHEALLAACGGGHVAVVKYLVQAGVHVDPSYSPFSECSALSRACKHPHPGTISAELVQLLLPAGANVNAFDNRGQTPLIHAAKAGSVEVVKLLIAVPVLQINQRQRSDGNSYAYTALHWACEKGHEAVALLLASDPRLNLQQQPGHHYCPHPLRMACEKGMLPVVVALLRHPHVNVNLEEKLAAKSSLWALPIHFACQANRPEVVQALLDHGASATAHDSSGATPLHWACNEGSLEVVALLLGKEGVEVDAVDQQGRTPLFAASGRKGAVALVRMLLAAGAQVAKARLSRGRTALHNACLCGDVEMVQLLLQTPGGHTFTAILEGPLVQGSYAHTPLQDACKAGCAQVVRLLLAVPGVDPNRHHPGTLSPFALACQQGHVEVVRLLLLVPVIDVTPRTADGKTVLHLAVRHPEVVQLLVAVEGVEVNARDAAGMTPLLLACQEGKGESVAALLAHPQLDVQLTGPGGKQALVVACVSGNVAAVRLLLQHPGIDPMASDGVKGGALHQVCGTAGLRVPAPARCEVLDQLLACQRVDVNTRDHKEKGSTPLMLAICSGNDAAVEKLLACSSLNINLGLPEDSTALHLACQHGRVKAVKVLLASGRVDVNAQDRDGSTPLHIACEGGHRAVVDVLLADDDVDANIQDVQGYAPLHSAAVAGTSRVVESLLYWDGLDAGAEDNEGDTALHLAVKHRRVSVVTEMAGATGVDVNAGDALGRSALDLAFEGYNDPTSERGKYQSIILALMAAHDVQIGAGVARELRTCLMKAGWR